MRVLAGVILALALGGCVDRSFTPTVPKALEIGTPYTVYAATTRAREANGAYGFRRSDRMQLLELTVSIPPGHRPGTIEFAYANPKPDSQFTIARRAQFPETGDFLTRLRQQLRAQPPGQRDVTVFVHGYNATQAETAMRAAQLAHDIDLPGALVIYSWPSRGHIAGYAYDNDSVLFARDGLEQLLDALQGVGAENVLLVAHSMGSLLTMETLRQADIRRPGWAARTLDAVLFISPDLDVEVFRSQMRSLSPPPDPFFVMVSEKDKVLNLSARLRGTADRERLGNLRHIGKIADLPVEVIDATAFTGDAESSHFVAATSPALLAILRDARSTTRTFGSEKLAIEEVLPARIEIRRTEKATDIVLLPPDQTPGQQVAE